MIGDISGGLHFVVLEAPPVMYQKVLCLDAVVNKRDSQIYSRLVYNRNAFESSDFLHVELYSIRLELVNAH